MRNVLGRRRITTWEDIFRDIERGNRRGEVRTDGLGGAAEARRPRRPQGRKKRQRSGPSRAELERQSAQRFLDDPRPDLSEKEPVPIMDVGDFDLRPGSGSKANRQWAAENIRALTAMPIPV